MKFKTTPERIKFWVTAHEQIYGDENLWQFKQNVVTLKVKEPNKGNLIVKFYLSTGVVLVQGSEFPRWRLELYSALKANVDLIQTGSMAGGSTGSNGASARSDEDNESQGYSVHVEGDDTKLKSAANRNNETSQSVPNNDEPACMADTDMNSASDTNYIRGDMVHKLENAYIHMCDTMSENMNDVKSEMDDIKHEIRKLPMKIHDMIKKENKAIIESMSDLRVSICEWDKYKQTIQNLTTQLQHQQQEMWKMQRTIAAYQSQAIGRSPTASPQEDQTQRSSSPSMSAANISGNAATCHHPPGHRVSAASPIQVQPSSPPQIQAEMRRSSRDANQAMATSTVSTPENRAQTPVGRPSSHPTPAFPPSVPQEATERSVDAERARLLPSKSESEDTDTDSSSSTDTDHEHERDPNRRKRQVRADAILIGDSTIKYVDSHRLMGRNMKVFIQRASTTAVVKNCVSNCEGNSDVVYAVVHSGVNDIRGGKSPGYIVNNLTNTLSSLKTLFSNAKVCYSEMLNVGCEQSNPDMNSNIRSVNEQMKAYCASNDMIFIQHSSLQTAGDDMFDDDVHISREGGTAVFVSDVHRAVGLHNNRQPARHGNRGGGQHRLRNRENGQNYGNNHDQFNRRQNIDNIPNSNQILGNSSGNWDQLCQLMLLNMMRGLRQEPQ